MSDQKLALKSDTFPFLGSENHNEWQKISTVKCHISLFGLWKSLWVTKLFPSKRKFVNIFPISRHHQADSKACHFQPCNFSPKANFHLDSSCLIHAGQSFSFWRECFCSFLPHFFYNFVNFVSLHLCLLLQSLELQKRPKSARFKKSWEMWTELRSGHMKRIETANQTLHKLCTSHFFHSWNKILFEELLGSLEKTLRILCRVAAWCDTFFTWCNLNFLGINCPLLIKCLLVQGQFKTSNQWIKVNFPFDFRYDYFLIGRHKNPMHIACSSWTSGHRSIRQHVSVLNFLLSKRKDSTLTKNGQKLVALI